MSKMFRNPGLLLTLAMVGALVCVASVAEAAAPRQPDNPTGDVAGMFYRFFNTGGNFVTENFNLTPPTSTGIIAPATIDFAPGGPDGSAQGWLSPRGAITDNIGFVYTGYITIPTSGTYTFFCESDDGSKIYIGKTLVASSDGPHGMVEAGGNIDLLAGKHAITLCFKQGGGGFGFNARWQGPGIGKQLIPGAQFTTIPLTTDHPAVTPPANTASGVFYNWVGVTGLAGSQAIPIFEQNVVAATGIVPKFDLITSPAPFRTDNYAFRYEGYIAITTAGTYNFYVESDDGSRIFVDNFLIVDNDFYQGMTERTGQINLAAGAHSIVVEFSQGGGGFGLVARYDGPDSPVKGEIPNAVLTTEPIAVAPVISPNGGSYTTSQQVTLTTTTAGTQIYYTLDGTTPSDTSGNLYSGPITLTGSVTLSAITLGTGYHPSPITSAAFFRSDLAPQVSMVGAYPNSTTVNVTFDRAVGVASAQTTGNYSIDNGVAVSAAVVDGTDPAVVHLTTSTLTAGTTYTITISNVQNTTGTPMAAPAVFPFQFYPTGTIARQYYDGIGGGAITDLTNNVNFPNNPTSQDEPILFEGPTNFDDDYGTRMRGYFYPPSTAQYTFSIATDDAGQLFLSSDESPSTKTMITFINSWTPSRVWTNVDGGGTNQQQFTTAANLIAGKRYYIEALQKEGGGGDNIAVLGVPMGTVFGNGASPIPGAQLSPYFDINEPIRITSHPADKAVLVNNSVTFSVTASGAALTYQWRKGGFDIGGATASTYTIPSAVLGDAGSYDVVITNPLGTATSNSANLTVFNPSAPTINGGGISPVIGPAIGGQTVTIDGTNFIVGQTSVSFDGILAQSVTVNNANQLTAVTPANIGGGVADVVVTVFGGQSATAAAAYTFIDPATVDNTAPNPNPNAGPNSGGQSVTITGTNFVTGQTAVSIGGIAATNVVVGSATSLTCDTGVRAGATATVTVVVTTFGTQAGPAGGSYTYFAAPTITPPLSPLQGPMAGGQTVTVNGTDFVTGNTTVTVAGSTVAATVLSAIQLTFTTPATGTGAGLKNVTVTTFTSQSGTANNSYEYLDFPTISGINPTQGPASGGQSVTIDGTNFPQDITQVGVTLVGVTATVNSVNLAGTQLIVTTGSIGVIATPQTGNVVVTTFPLVSAQASAPFASYTYVPPPAITTIDPANGPLVGGADVTMTGTNLGTATVDFDGTNVVPSTNNATTIIVTPPNRPAGTGTVVVTVTTPGGTTTTNYTYWDPPTVTAVNPIFGVTAGGTSVTVTGTNFFSNGASPIAVDFGGSALTGITVNSTTSLTGTTSAHLVGAVDVTVTTFGLQTSPALVGAYNYNDPPTANAQAVTTNEDTAANITLTANDPNLDTLTYAITVPPANGVLSNFNAAAGTVTYTPDPDYNGPDSFTFSASDAFATSSADVSITVTAVNDLPVADAQAVSTGEGVAVNITLTGADLDPEVVQALTFAIVTQPTKGTLSNLNAAAGTVTYTPSALANGTDTFTFTVTDDGTAGAPANLTSVAATVTITVGALNNPPTTNTQSVITGIQRPVTIILSGDDSDPEVVQVLTFAISTPPANGTLSGLNAATGTVTYTPNNGFSGVDTFAFTITDDAAAGPPVNLTSAPATVTITVTPPPAFTSTPTVTPDAAIAGQPLVFSAATVTASTITWDFGDGSSATGGTVTHSYVAPGIYTATVFATSSEGVTTTFAVQVFVGLGTSTGGTGATVAGATGILVGGAGQQKAQGGTGKLFCNFVKRNRTWASGSVGMINFPTTLTYASMQTQPGILTLGKGALAQTFFFTLDKRGRGRATSLQKIQVDLAKKRILFKVNNRAALTDLAESLGANYTRTIKNGPLVTVLLPATLQVGTQLYLAMTFQLEYHQKGTSGTAGLKP